MPIIKGISVTQRLLSSFELSVLHPMKSFIVWKPQLRSYRENTTGKDRRQVTNDNLIPYPNPRVISELNQEWGKNPWGSKRCTWDFFFLEYFQGFVASAWDAGNVLDALWDELCPSQAWILLWFWCCCSNKDKGIPPCCGVHGFSTAEDQCWLQSAASEFCCQLGLLSHT